MSNASPAAGVPTMVSWKVTYTSGWPPTTVVVPDVVDVGTAGGDPGDVVAVVEDTVVDAEGLGVGALLVQLEAKAARGITRRNHKRFQLTKRIERTTGYGSHANGAETLRDRPERPRGSGLTSGLPRRVRSLHVYSPPRLVEGQVSGSRAHRVGSAPLEAELLHGHPEYLCDGQRGIDRRHVLAALVARPRPLGDAGAAGAGAAAEVVAEASAELQAELAHATGDRVHISDLSQTV